MELWSAAHLKTLLPSIGVMLVLCVLFRLWLGKMPRRIRMIPLQVIAVILLVLEVGKQAVSFSCGYDLYHIPLHFCSLFLFSIPLMAFYRGKHDGIVSTLTTVLCGSATLLMTVYPALIYSSGNIEAYFSDFMSFHTVTFHTLVYFAFLLILTLQLYGDFGRRERKVTLVAITIYSVVAAVVSQLLKTNFTNMYHCNVPPIEDLRQTLIASWGYAPAQLLYVGVLTVGHILFLWGLFALCKLLARGADRLFGSASEGVDEA
ncbi:MAG: YwaF family protein [Clostridia bacterium]|nr:YwaF family protein [Clostridia bacterium]